MKWLLAAAGLLVAATCQAADIRLTNGVTYRDATILQNNGKDLEVRYAYQRLRIPLAMVHSIDDAPLPHASAAAASATPPLQAAPVTVPAPALAAPAVPAAPVVRKAKPKTAQNDYRWDMELWILGFAVFSVTWMVSVTSVQRDLFKRRNDSRFWSNFAMIVPIGGALAYFTWIGALNLARVPKTAYRPRKRKRDETDEPPPSKRIPLEFLDEENRAIAMRKDGILTGIDTAQAVLEDALADRASDIHIEPNGTEYRVRFRIDGVMESRASFHRDDGVHVVAALKTLAHIDVAEKRKAQDGRFRARSGEDEIDFRVASTHSIFGEKVVIRILNPKIGMLKMNELGMSTEMLDQLVRVIQSRSGMIIATGPTGSGKTSTLYSLLSQLDSARRNIVTIEDPVEYVLKGATQMPVNVRAGITYESGLRSLLRQDPDVLFVGEMRDYEAAEIAIRAALTGHLLFTSLHTKDAIGSIIRLEELGIERSQLASALLVIVAQRLVRILCPSCRRPVTTTGEELREIGLGIPRGAQIYAPCGCRDCQRTGYIGRTGLFEMVVFDEDLRQAVSEGVGEFQLNKLAERKGARSYREDGIEKLLQGITSVEELLQAI